VQAEVLEGVQDLAVGAHQIDPPALALEVLRYGRGRAAGW
jgi:hypothetical protein